MKKIFLLIFTCFISILFINIVKAEQYNITCHYLNSDTNEEYVIDFFTSGTVIEMKSCKFGKITGGYSDCSRYTFDSNGLWQDNPKYCPGSIDVSGSKITWIAQKKGKYVSNSPSNTEKAKLSDISPCFDYSQDKGACLTNNEVACVWVGDDKTGYCNVDDLQYVFCGDAYDIPRQAPKIISFGINFMKIVTPIILIFVGTITLIKAITASKEDEIKKATSSLIKKLISAALVFFVTSIVQFVILKVAEDSDKNGITSCLSCFLNNECNSAYYKETFKGFDYCRLVSDNSEITCPRDIINK